MSEVASEMFQTLHIESVELPLASLRPLGSAVSKLSVQLIQGSNSTRMKADIFSGKLASAQTNCWRKSSMRSSEDVTEELVETTGIGSLDFAGGALIFSS